MSKIKVLCCNRCGGTMIEIRGRYPKDPRRMVCPTCAFERLETIHDMTRRDYGTAYTNTNKAKNL